MQPTKGPATDASEAASASSSKPRILVGVLHTIENEYEECMRGIEMQQEVDVDCFVVRNKRNKEAHVELYHCFMAHADSVDLFVKVDADMVIENPLLFQQIATVFSQARHVQMITISVWDFFTARLIKGMHAFRHDATWDLTDEPVFTDEAPKVKTKISCPELAPAAIHCKDPSEFQSFHFGVHKGVKVRASLHAGRKRAVQLRYHLENVDQVWEQLGLRGDRRLLLAALGGELAIRGDFSAENVDFDNPKTLSVFEEYAAMPSAELTAVAEQLRVENRRALPSKWRVELRSIGLYKYVTRRIVPTRIRSGIRRLRRRLRHKI